MSDAAERSERFLTPRDAAARLVISERAVRNGISRGELRAVKVCRRVRIAERDFETWVADSVLLCVLAYAGLRPSEALPLRFGDVGERTLLVERSLGPDGALKRTKTGQIRSVRLMAPLREDLVA